MEPEQIASSENRISETPEEMMAVQLAIIQSLEPLAEALRRKDWPVILQAGSPVRIQIKGTPRTADQAERFIKTSTSAIRDVRIIVETVLDKRICRKTAEFTLRIAALGTTESGARDGIIMDIRILFSKLESLWSIDELDVDCPPLWAQWNSRPNDLAPIHYADPGVELE